MLRCVPINIWRWRQMKQVKHVANYCNYRKNIIKFFVLKYLPINIGTPKIRPINILMIDNIVLRTWLVWNKLGNHVHVLDTCNITYISRYNIDYCLICYMICYISFLKVRCVMSCNSFKSLNYNFFTKLFSLGFHLTWWDL